MATTAVDPCAVNAVDDHKANWPVVLCVDDDPNMIAALERSFRPYQIRLERAFHGMQGIMKAVTTRPDVIVTDLSMPLASGDELIDCLTHNPATEGTPIIVITGRIGTKLTARHRQQGVIDVLVKPLGFDKLLEAIGSVVKVVRVGETS